MKLENEKTKLENEKYNLESQVKTFKERKEQLEAEIKTFEEKKLELEEQNKHLMEEIAKGVQTQFQQNFIDKVKHNKRLKNNKIKNIVKRKMHH